jgi:hypothetical protein
MTDPEFAVHGWDLILGKLAKYNVEAFLYFFLGAALQAKSFTALDRLIVDEIHHIKVEGPDFEQDFLIIHTIDSTNGNRKIIKFILERMILTGERSNTENTSLNTNTDIDDEINDITPFPFTTKIYASIKKLVESIFSALTFESTSESRLALEQRAMEEGSLPSFSPTASVASDSLDSVTVSVSETADSVSDAIADSLNQNQTPALDRFLGEGYTRKAKYSGTTLRSFKPVNLSFFEFVVLAHVVHRRFPQYTRLKKIVYFMPASFTTPPNDMVVTPSLVLETIIPMLAVGRV